MNQLVTVEDQRALDVALARAGHGLGRAIGVGREVRRVDVLIVVDDAAWPGEPEVGIHQREVGL